MSELDDLLERKRREAIGFNKSVASEGFIEVHTIENKDAVLLATAAGVLPSTIAQIFGLSYKTIKKTIEDNKSKVEEYCRLLTVDYQAIRVNMLFDTAISKLQEIIEDDATNAASVIAAIKEISKMIKEGDVAKVFNREVMDDTYESAPDNVSEMLKKIKEIEERSKKVGL
jgi:hypothetical protein